jgi:hypothetical protein
MTTRNNLLTLFVALAVVVVFFSVLSVGGSANSLFPTCEQSHHFAFVTICDSDNGGG